MTRQREPDVAIVGGGYAGLMAAGRLIIGGRSVLLIDPKPRFGKQSVGLGPLFLRGTNSLVMRALLICLSTFLSRHQTARSLKLLLPTLPKCF